jgi:hypothetical protein
MWLFMHVVKVRLCPMFPDFRKNTAFWKVHSLFIWYDQHVDKDEYAAMV